MTQLTYIDTATPPRRHRTGGWISIADAWTRRHRAILLAVAALWRFIGLGLGEMQQWDEAIYALRVRVILHTGELWDQSAHMLAGSYFSAHPPLYVWMSTFWTLLLGDAVWTHRLASAVAGATLVLLTYHAARKMLPAGLSLAAALFAAFSPLLSQYSVLGQLDVLLALCMFASIVSGFEYVRHGRTRDLMIGGLVLGAALMTKMLFALTIPMAMLIASVLLSGMQRKRAAIFALAATAISFPVWVPWLISFVLAHGQGDPLYLFSSAVPLGATLAGHEGMMKETGSLFYSNQLIVHVSALLPFAALALWRTLRERTSVPFTVLGVWVVVQLFALLAARSSFEVYLIPLLVPLVLFAMRGVQLARRVSVPWRRALLVASAICLAWSLSLTWRAAVKSLIGIGTGGVPDGETLFRIVLVLAVSAAGVFFAWHCAGRHPAKRVFSSSTLYFLVALLAAASFWNMAAVRPGQLHDGAEETAACVLASGASAVALIGNGENPQLTWYLDGADIGWGDGGTSYERLEPRTRGIATIVERLNAIAAERSIVAVVELDEIAQGIYRTPHDVLPKGFRIILSTRRYVVASSVPRSHRHERSRKQ